MEPRDAARVLEIYAMGIRTRLATFETAVPSWRGWDLGHLRHTRIVLERGGAVLGWAALSAMSRREAYSGVAEVSCYVDPGHRGEGVGTGLLGAVVAGSEGEGVWTLQASVFPGNRAAMGLLKKHGFRVVGTRERIARLEGVWMDTVLLERRSRGAGGG